MAKKRDEPLTKRQFRELCEDREHPVRYVSQMPRKPKPGWVLAHNYVRHTANMQPDRNGFRAWWYMKSVPDNFKPCRCGWSKLPHVSTRPNYKCEPEKVIAAFD